MGIIMLSPKQFGGTGSPINPVAKMAGIAQQVKNPMKPTFKNMATQPGQLSSGYQKSYNQRNAQIKQVKPAPRPFGFK